MKNFAFDLQRFVIPTLLSGEDGGGVRYWNTIPGAAVSGFGNTFFVNHGAGCVIYCEGDNTKVYNDTVAPNVVINGAGGHDWLINDAVNVEIYGGGGQDDILNYANNARLDGGDGDDAIQNQGGSKVEIYGGANNDWIYNKGSIVTIDGGAGHNRIENEGSKVTIIGGGDEDNIYNVGSYTSIIGGSGNNVINNGTIEGHLEYVQETYDRGTWKYVIDKAVDGGSNVTIIGGEDKDIITNYNGKNVTIDAGGGDNEISLGGDKSHSISVKATTGNDTVIAYERNFVESSFGLPSGSGSDIIIEAGDGNNVIHTGSNWSDMWITTGDGKDEIVSKGNYVYIKSGKTNDAIENYGDNAVIMGEDGDDIIINHGSKVYINGGGGEPAGSGYEYIDDYIYTDEGSSVTVDGGANADRILAYHDVEASILGGDGDDYIALQRTTAKTIWNIIGSSFIDIPKSYAEDKIKAAALERTSAISKPLGVILEQADNALGVVEKINSYWNMFKSYTDLLSAGSTVIGGEGNDIIVSDGIAPRVFQYSKGHGNDTIYYFNTNKALVDNIGLNTPSLFLSTLHITDELIREVEVTGTDVIFKVANGSIKLVDAANKKFKLKESDGTLTTRAYGKDSSGNVICSIFGSSSNEDIQDNVGIERDKTVYIGEPGSYIPNDRIIGSVNRNVIYGEGGNDNLRGNDQNDTIYGGAGNDLIYGGAGDDVLYGDGGKDKIYGGAGDDTIYSLNNDTIYSYKSTLDGGENNDKIYNYSDEASINGGAGEDFIYSTGNQVTITGGLNDDVISLKSGSEVNTGGNVVNYSSKDVITYHNGDGNDIVHGFSSCTTLKIIGAEYSTLQSGSDVLVKVGGGTITLKNYIYAPAINPLHIEGTQKAPDLPEGISIIDGVLKIANAFLGEKVDVNDFQFPIETLDASELLREIILIGNDLVHLLKGGKSNDIIRTLPMVLSNSNGMSADSDTDAIEAVTIHGGAGDDTIYSDGTVNLFEYAVGDGQDVIFGFGSEDTLEIVDEIYSTQKSGADVIVKVGSGSILLKDASGIALNIDGTFSGSDTTPAGMSISGGVMTVSEDFANDTINLTQYESTITKVDASARTSDIIIIGNARDNSIKGGQGKSSMWGGDSTSNDTLIGGGGSNAFWYGKNEGTDVIKNAHDGDIINLHNISLSDLTKAGEVSGKLTIATETGSLKIDNKAAPIFRLADGTAWQYSYSSKTWAEVNPKTASDTTPAGISISNSILTASSTFTGSSIDLANYSGVTKVNASALSRGISITGTAAANSIKGGSGADTISGGLGNDTVSLGGGADVYIYSGGNDLIQDYAAADKIKLASASITGASLSSSNVILTTNKGNITVKGGKGKAITVIDKNGTTTTKTYPESTVPAGISVSGAILTASSSFTGSKIDLADYASTVTKVNASALSRGVSIIGGAKANSLKGGKGADTLDGGSGNDTLYGGNGNDILYGGAGADKIYGEAGNDTLYGGAGNDTFTGGNGSDVFVYESGNDLIADYKAGEDKIKLASASITGASLSSSNVILATSKGNITVKGGKGKAVTVIDKNGSETTKIYPETSSDNLAAGLSYDSAKKKLIVGTSYGGAAIDLKNFASTTKTVDASAFTKKISITGNNLGDSIKGGSGADTLTGGTKADTIYGGTGNDKIYGGTGADKLFGDAGNDTLYGGTGNDTLTGGAGKDVFVYGSGDGKDVIADYTAGQDKIKISSGKISGTSYSGSNVIFTVGSGTLTVQNGKGKKISIVDASGKTSTKTYNGNAVYGTSALMADDNFISNDTRLDEITEAKFAVSGFGDTSGENMFGQNSSSEIAITASTKDSV